MSGNASHDHHRVSGGSVQQRTIIIVVVVIVIGAVIRSVIVIGAVVVIVLTAAAAQHERGVVRQSGDADMARKPCSSQLQPELKDCEQRHASAARRREEKKQLWPRMRAQRVTRCLRT